VKLTSQLPEIVGETVNLQLFQLTSFGPSLCADVGWRSDGVVMRPRGCSRCHCCQCAGPLVWRRVL